MMDIFKHARTMTNDEYHAEREHLSSSRVKAALIHPERMTAPSTIRADVAAEGNRIHTAVIEPDEPLQNLFAIRLRYPRPLVRDHQPGAICGSLGGSLDGDVDPGLRRGELDGVLDQIGECVAAQNRLSPGFPTGRRH